MPVTTTYPGVYVEEIPSGVRTITGVATSITAFVGAAPRGPVNVPTTVNSFGGYQRTFGGLALSSMMSFAVSDFFANGGSQAIIVRLAHSDAIAATITLPEDVAENDAQNHGALPATGFSALVLQAQGPGAWGNQLGAIVDTRTADPADLSLFNLTLTMPDAFGEPQPLERFANCSVDPNSARYIATVLAESSGLAVVAEDASHTAKVPGKRPAATAVASSGPPKPVSSDGKGADGGRLTDDDLTGTGLRDSKQGLYALDNADLFSTLR